jgi:enolase
MSAIRQIRGVEILDSRGNPTDVAEVLLVNGEIAPAFTGQSVSTMATAMQRLPREGKAAG